MKILLVSLNFAPELTGIGKYSGEMVDGLLARGHEVAVVCAPPHYPHWQLEPGYSAWAYRVERPSPGLTVHRCPIWVPARAGGSRRLLHLMGFALSSLPVMVRLVLWRPQVVFAVAPALFCAPAAWLAARLAGAKAWLHIQDFETDAAFELGLLKPPWLRRAASRVERLLMSRFDVVSTLSHRMLRRLSQKGVPTERTELFPNWVDTRALRPLDDTGRLRRSLGIGNDAIVCLYAGSINRKQGLDVVIETARLLRDDENIVFVICGNGELRLTLEAQSADLNSVRFMDLQPLSAFNEVLNMADIHLLPQLQGAADLVMPSKLAGMLASGRPVIAGAHADSEIASIVDTCGIVTEPENAVGFANAISALARDPVRRQGLGAAGRAHAEQWLDAERVFSRLHLRLQTLVGTVAATLVEPMGSATRVGRGTQPIE